MIHQKAIFFLLLTITLAFSQKFIDTSTCGKGKSKSCYLDPPGCYNPVSATKLKSFSTSENRCERLASWEVNSKGELVIELQAFTKGYIALGFSKDTLMGDDTVVLCKLNGQTGEPEAKLGYNPKRGKESEILSAQQGSQVDLTLIDTFSNQTSLYLYCKVKRLLAPSVDINEPDKRKIFDLGQGAWFVMLVTGQGAGDKIGEHRHIPRPLVSAKSIEFSSGNHWLVLGTYSRPLIKAHGIIMVFAWIGCALFGSLFPKFYRKMWPNEPCCFTGVWFANHRVFGILTAALSIVGLIIIIIELKWSWTTYARSHAILGMIVIILGLLQVIVAFVDAVRQVPSDGYLTGFTSYSER